MQSNLHMSRGGGSTWLTALLVLCILFVGRATESVTACPMPDDDKAAETVRTDRNMPGAGQRPETQVGAKHPIAVVEKAPPSKNPNYNVRPTILSSPRATMWSLGRTVNDYKYILTTEGRTRENEREVGWIEEEIAYCFDVEDIAPKFQDAVATDAAVYLRAMMRRVPMPVWETIPDAAGIAAMSSGESRDFYRMLDVPIELIRIQSGDREGNWVISKETRDRAFRAYERVMMEKPIAGEGDLVRLHFFEPGWLIPSFLVQDLPAWSGSSLLGQSLWQWCATLVALLVLFLVFALISLISKHNRPKQLTQARRFLRLIVLILVGWLMYGFMHFLEYHVFLNGMVLEVFAVGSTVIMMVAFIGAILTLGNIFAIMIIAVRGTDSTGMDPALIRVMVRSFSIVIAIILLARMLGQIGFSPTTLLAGAGVTGLAFALAAQDTLKNFFSSIILLTERPFREGDTICIGNDRGKVESLGLRSTSLRISDGNLIYLPNGEITHGRIENISRRPHIRCDIKLGVTYDTSVEKLDEGVSMIRAILEETVVTPYGRPPRVFFSDFADSSLVIKCTYWQSTTNYVESLEISQKINLEILNRFRKAGLDFAFPTMTLEMDDGATPPTPEDDPTGKEPAS